MHSPEEGVLNFLREWKKACDLYKISFVNRPKNLESIKQLGLTVTGAKELLRHLTVQDYVAGPKADKDKPGEVWEFGLLINGIEVYVKVKLFEFNDEKKAKCISFHSAEHRLSFPFCRR